MLVVDEDQVAMPIQGQLVSGDLEAGAAYLSPIWAILKEAMSPRLFESPPLGALDRVMVRGSTVLGSSASSCLGAGSTRSSTITSEKAARQEDLEHLSPKIAECGRVFDRQTGHAIWAP